MLEAIKDVADGKNPIGSQGEGSHIRPAQMYLPEDAPWGERKLHCRGQSCFARRKRWVRGFDVLTMADRLAVETASRALPMVAKPHHWRAMASAHNAAGTPAYEC